jgi:DNA-binding YbaB/EbfC family protein
MSDQFDLGSMLSQAMAMQQQFEDARAQAAAREFIGQAGGGAVAIRITGGLHVLNVSISPEAVDPADVPMLEDLVLAAFHDALAQIDAKHQ